MCWRFEMSKEEIKLHMREFEILFGVVARYNIAPAQKTYVSRALNNVRNEGAELFSLQNQWISERAFEHDDINSKVQSSQIAERHPHIIFPKK